MKMCTHAFYFLDDGLDVIDFKACTQTILLTVTHATSTLEARPSFEHITSLIRSARMYAILNGGIAITQTNAHKTIISKLGNIIPCVFKSAKPFANGETCVYNPLVVNEMDENSE